MASNKYFVVKKTSDGTETLVAAPRAQLAKVAVVGGKLQAKAANEQQIVEHFQSGYALHPKSREEGDGKMFLVAAVPPILVRAKNAGEAVSLTDDSTDYEVKQATHEIIVRLMTSNVQVVTYSDQPKGVATLEKTDCSSDGQQPHASGDAAPNTGSTSNAEGDTTGTQQGTEDAPSTISAESQNSREPASTIDSQPLADASDTASAQDSGETAHAS